MAMACHRWFEAVGKSKLKNVLAREYPEIKKISIDYALMEKAQNVVVADGSFGWDDLGSWPALARHLKADSAGNCAVADYLQVDSARNIIYDARTVMRTPICTLGLRDCIIVLTDDATLVAHKTQAQRMKELVKKMAESKEYKKYV
jgi:mannose-1-phosphate guanylyltransferase